jgi:hypothetical protein
VAKKKRSSRRSQRSKPQPAKIPPPLTEIEQDLLSHIEHGYQLETDSLGSDLLLRKRNEVIRTASANRNTVKALEERGLITQGKSRDPLRIVWWMADNKPK